ncbi:MAG: large conductance mechanosensitive channel protein MscL [Bacteroidetes bacterium]|nr:large conductance mechanosensitive channel protein MscL [Bacteroidota bacterium]
MGIVKEFKQFALRGNLVDIAVAFVMGGAFGKVVSTFTEKMVAPVIGLMTGGVNFYDKKFILKGEISEVRDQSGKVVVPHADAVALEWGTFITVLIDFIIVAFAMFMVVKAINALKKKEEASSPSVSSTDSLLIEIRDALKAK